MSRTVNFHNRRNINFSSQHVLDVLPEYFPSTYPNLISFLEKYYESMEQDYRLIEVFRNGLYSLRDLEEVDIRYLDSIFYEIGNGARDEYFQDPRMIGKLLHLLIQNRGTEFSVELFFRLFFGDVPEIIYPKDQMLYVFSGDSTDQQRSKIGVTDRRIMQNGARYQLLSVVIRSGVSIDLWESLYRKFVHTAGFFLSAEVVIENDAFSTSFADDLVDDLGINSVTVEPSVEEVDNMVNFTGLLEIAHHIDSGGTVFITNVEKTPERYADIDVGYLDSHYENIFDQTRLASFTMDEDSDGIVKYIETSTDLEKMDADKILINYNADSA